jgi:hypothetical protein
MRPGGTHRLSQVSYRFAWIVPSGVSLLVGEVGLHAKLALGDQASSVTNDKNGAHMRSHPPFDFVRLVRWCHGKDGPSDP